MRGSGWDKVPIYSAASCWRRAGGALLGEGGMCGSIGALPPMGMSGVCLTGFPVQRAQEKQSHVASRQWSEAAIPLGRKGGFPPMLHQHLVRSRTSVFLLICREGRGGGAEVP